MRKILVLKNSYSPTPKQKKLYILEPILLISKHVFWLLLGVEDTVHLKNEWRLTNLLFSLFSSYFVLLFYIVLCQLCLLHQVKGIIFMLVICDCVDLISLVLGILFLYSRIVGHGI